MMMSILRSLWIIIPEPKILSFVILLIFFPFCIIIQVFLKSNETVVALSDSSMETVVGLELESDIVLKIFVPPKDSCSISLNFTTSCN